MYNPQAATPAFAPFTSHRRVRAAEITKIYSPTCVGVGPHGFSVEYEPKGKPTPAVGWYVIAYEDGYLSFCPPEQFKAGYHANREPALSLEETKALVATRAFPRVTEDSIKEKIRAVDYYRHGHLVICVLELQNGFFVVGKAAPADVRNFDEGVGRRYAYEDAFRQIWPLEGYALREQLAD